MHTTLIRPPHQGTDFSAITHAKIPGMSPNIPYLSESSSALGGPRTEAASGEPCPVSAASDIPLPPLLGLPHLFPQHHATPPVSHTRRDAPSSSPSDMPLGRESPMLRPLIHALLEMNKIPTLPLVPNTMTSSSKQCQVMQRTLNVWNKLGGIR